MSDIIDISKMTKKFKVDLETKQFADGLVNTIVALEKQLKDKDEEISALKKQLQGEYEVEKIIVSPEEALLSSQLFLIQERSYQKELTLEDVKKLDILLKNQKILRDTAATLKGESKKVTLDNNQLLQIIQNGTK